MYQDCLPLEAQNQAFAQRLAVDGPSNQPVRSVLRLKLGSPVLATDGRETYSPVPPEAQTDGRDYGEHCRSVVSTVRPGQSWPRPGLVCETQPALVHGPRAHRIFGDALVWTGSAGGPGKRGRSHDPLSSYHILGGGCASDYN